METDLKVLEELEASNATQQATQQIKPEMNITTEEPVNILDGYIKIDKSTMPQEGMLYPESWEFAYRCPTAKEVANFSTINENDQPAVIVAIEDLIRKCVMIYDTELESQVNNGEINDAHRTWFLLVLRDFYLPGLPIQSKTICLSCQNAFDSLLTASKLQYNELNEKLLNAFDGRVFNLTINEQNVQFRIPTLETSGRIFKYIVKTYRNSQSAAVEKKEDNIAYDKQFLLFAPYLYITGKETIRELTYKYKAIIKNNLLFKAYLEVINKLKLDNEDKYADVCPECGSEEETQVKFPGGFKNLFITNTDNTGYFD